MDKMKEVGKEKNIKLTIQYFGTNFSGSQMQKNERTVQGEIESALLVAFDKKTKVTFSGRTDSGVHAKRQVLNFRVKTEIPTDKIKFFLRRFLPDDIFIISSEEVPDSFNSRFAAKERSYRYYFHREEDLFLKGRSFLYKKEIDIGRLNSIAEKNLIGKKNFKSFCASRSTVSSFICDLKVLKFHKINETEVYLEVKANRFLHNMIRIFVSLLLEINEGTILESDIIDILNSEDRRKAPKTGSPSGLYLWEILY